MHGRLPDSGLSLLFLSFIGPEPMTTSVPPRSRGGHPKYYTAAESPGPTNRDHLPLS